MPHIPASVNGGLRYGLLCAPADRQATGAETPNGPY